MSGFCDEDEYDGFFTDPESLEDVFEYNENNPRENQELTHEQKLNILFYAIMNQDVSAVVSILDEEDLNSNETLKDGWKPIILAASVGNVDIIRELLNRGANVDDERDKYTPLMAACSCPESETTQTLEAVTYLIENGANVKATNRKRKTALMFAAGAGNVQVINKLLPICDMNVVDNQGWNALFWAVNYNQIEVVKLLLEAGEDPDKRDIRYNTCLHYAIHKGYEEIIQLMSKEDITDISHEMYDLKELYSDERPQFLRDIYCLLYGMKCENLAKFFNRIALGDFLSLNNKLITELGITMPYERKKILQGLHKFHKHLFKQKSLPIVPKSALYSTIDVSTAIVVITRQIIIMEASLKYILNGNEEDTRKFNTHTTTMSSIRNRLKNLKKYSIELKSKTKMWDSTNREVDLITRNSFQIKKHTKWLIFFSVLIVSGFTFRKQLVNYS